jgi:hypothetical protein
MPDIELDHLIDSVARQMTAGDPPALRASVMRRLGPHRSRLWRSSMPYAAASVVAVLVVAVLSRSSRSVEPTAPAPAVASAPHRFGEVPRSARPTRVTPLVPAASRPNSTPGDFGLPTLPAPAPLNEDPAVVEPIQPAPLSIPQLTVQPMKELPPLTIPALGDIDRHP